MHTTEAGISSVGMGGHVMLLMLMGVRNVHTEEDESLSWDGVLITFLNDEDLGGSTFAAFF